VKKFCLNCKHYRLKDAGAGICRVNKRNDTEYPVKRNEDLCDEWLDCGQNYHIRRGWINGQKGNR